MLFLLIGEEAVEHFMCKKIHCGGFVSVEVSKVVIKLKSRIGPRQRMRLVHLLILSHMCRQVFLDFDKNKGKETQIEQNRLFLWMVSCNLRYGEKAFLLSLSRAVLAC